MNEQLFQTQYDVTKKTRLKKFYEKNKILIFSLVLILVISVISAIFYSESKKNKKILLSEDYIKATIYLKNEEIEKAENILKDIIYANDKTYSVLSLFLIINENLIVDKAVVENLFEHVLENNEFEEEIENLIIFKKALFHSNFVAENQLLETLKPILNTDSLWKPHALMLLGDYFAYKKEYFKAKEFYTQILSIKNLNKEFYEQARYQLLSIENE